jgi:DNA-directed RNA polymerase sigma subunit (sigma70/sigma32)
MSTAIQPKISPSLPRHLHEVFKYPILSSEEELVLVRRSREHQDSCCTRLVSSHLRLVARISGDYRVPRPPFDDLISEGNFAMLQAVQCFDPDRGCRVATYAKRWIRAAIQNYEPEQAK